MLRDLAWHRLSISKLCSTFCPAWAKIHPDDMFPFRNVSCLVKLYECIWRQQCAWHYLDKRLQSMIVSPSTNHLSIKNNLFILFVSRGNLEFERKLTASQTFQLNHNIKEMLTRKNEWKRAHFIHREADIHWSVSWVGEVLTR